MGTALDKPLRRNSDNAILTGVCAGIADWLGWDVTLVRVLYVVISTVSAAIPGVLLYVILSFVMPSDRSG